MRGQTTDALPVDEALATTHILTTDPKEATNDAVHLLEDQLGDGDEVVNRDVTEDVSS